MSDGLWQQDALERLARELEADGAAVAVAAIGSCANPDAPVDEWSDVDLAIVAAEEAVGRLASPGWLCCLGEPYAAEPGALGACRTLRCYLADGRRIDSIVVPETAFADQSVRSRIPFAYGARVLFSRTPLLERAIAEAQPDPREVPTAPDDFARLAGAFRFKAMMAVSKVARGDRLVALHLSLDLVRDCLLLSMMLRDRATGTCHHRDGRGGNHLVEALEATQQPFTSGGILESIRRSAIAFDALAAEWDPEYQERRDPLLRFADRVGQRLDS